MKLERYIKGKIFMKNIKFKILILLVITLMTSQYKLDIFANTSSENNPVVKRHETILDGEIGEWDPALDDKPDFDADDVEVDGNTPQQGEYYTISVTVPLKMEFFVLQNMHLPSGSFFSPVYTIKNNGTKNISVSLESFDRVDIQEDENTTNLYVESINPDDNKTQMELQMCTLSNLDDIVIDKSVDLTRIGELQDSDKNLYNLSANESKGITFNAKKWELPQKVLNKEEALSNFNANFVFSINR